VSDLYHWQYQENALKLSQMFSGMELAVHKPQRPPVVPNSDTLLQGIVQSKSEWVICVPSIVEVRLCPSPVHCVLLRSILGMVARPRDSENSEGSRQAHREFCMAVFRVVLTRPQLFSGGPLNKQVGDYLTKEGIAVDPGYGVYVASQ
jgi:hypothetical protein